MDQGNRQMFAVDINCGECGTHISELPFQPSGDRPVYCSDCLRARRSTTNRRGGMGGGMGGGMRRERKMYDVDVQCAECGAQITQLPFVPSGDRPVYCMSCNATRRAA